MGFGGWEIQAEGRVKYKGPEIRVYQHVQEGARRLTLLARLQEERKRVVQSEEWVEVKSCRAL